MALINSLRRGIIIKTEVNDNENVVLISDISFLESISEKVQ